MVRSLILLLTLSALSLLEAVELRVATYNVLSGIEAPGTTSHDALQAVLDRINADVIGLQEVAAADLRETPSNLDILAANLGYPYIFVPSGIALDTNSRVVLLSKFPFTETHSIASPEGARDVARAHAAAVIDVPGTPDEADPTIVTLHLKCCFELDDFFRRAVELARVSLFLDAQGLTGADNIIVMGDYNLLGSDTSYSTLPPGLPSTFQLGADIPFPLAYFSEPTPYFSAYPLLDPEPRQQDGIAQNTFSGGSVLDYMMVSQALMDRGVALEIYNSEREESFPGLPKSGPALPANTSDLASDHYPIFGDVDLDAGAGELDITLATAILTEGAAPTALTVTLPIVPGLGESVTVLLSSSACDEAMPREITLTFGPGETSKSTTLIPKGDSIIDGPQEITLTASAAGFGVASERLTVLDQDTASYQLTALGVPVTEAFDAYLGTQAPASWISTDPDFHGLDQGTFTTRGPRSYGVGNDGSLGLLTGEEVTFTSDFTNQTGATITSLHLSYTAEQWRSFFNGGADQLQVSLITATETTVIPELTFTSQTDQPTGPLAEVLSTSFETTLTDLDIPANATFQLAFQALPGTPPEPEGQTAFINEFHYDNTGSDQEEFVEIILGPNFNGTIDELSLFFYNGLNNTTYRTTTFGEENLDQTLSSGHRIYSGFISGIQNGAADGIALVHHGAVLQFLSYEGSLTAADGPAIGLTSTDIGVAQSPAALAGQGSLGLAGEAADLGDFIWTNASGPFSMGALNENQTLLAYTQGQGFAIDDLTVTPFTTDVIVTLSPDFILSFPTQSGATYEVESSPDLIRWFPEATLTGDGLPVSLDVTTNTPRHFFRVSQSL